MHIKQCVGYELEKEKSNTSEDFFNRSEVTYIENGIEKTLHVLYVRYFDQLYDMCTPFKEDPLFKVGERDIFLRDMVALACFITNPQNRHRKRIYINSEREFISSFDNLDFSKIQEIFQALENNRGFDFNSPLEFVLEN